MTLEGTNDDVPSSRDSAVRPLICLICNWDYSEEAHNLGFTSLTWIQNVASSFGKFVQDIGFELYMGQVLEYLNHFLIFYSFNPEPSRELFFDFCSVIP